MVRTIAFIAVALIAFLFIVSLIAPNVLSVLPARNNIPEGGYWQSVDNQGRTHISPGEEHPAYNSVPATSGWHYDYPDAPVAWRAYTEDLPNEKLVHNLEHGGIGMHYNCPDGCPELVEQLEQIRDEKRRVILSPFPGMDTTIALTAWDYIDKFDEFDEERIRQFISAHLDSRNAPESGAR